MMNNICPNCFNSSYSNRCCSKCGYREGSQRDERALPVGSILCKRYYIGKILGIGGFGITYVAYDLQLKERRAIKEYFPSEWVVRGNDHCDIRPTSENKMKAYQYGKDEFVNEAKILAGLNYLPNIVKVKDFFYENGTAYMVMELLEGPTLSGYMREHKLMRMPPEMAGNILEVVAETLVQLHKHMLLHRDISPDNIMFTKGGRIKLIDFGSTRVYAMNSMQSMSVFVKPGFAPPEQYSRTGQGPWTDVYALAATYYYLVSGQKVPDGLERKLMGTKLPYLSDLVPGIPMEISKTINHALEVMSNDRPQTMSDFLMEYRKNKQGSLGIAPGFEKESHTTLSPTMPVERNRRVVRRSPHLNGNHRRPSIVSQINGIKERHYFPPNAIVQIGRIPVKNQVVLSDRQVGRVHCQIQYLPEKHRFLVVSRSTNKTYTRRGNLRTGQMVYLVPGDWIYIQTAKNRYIFYMEEE